MNDLKSPPILGKRTRTGGIVYYDQAMHDRDSRRIKVLIGIAAAVTVLIGLGVL